MFQVEGVIKYELDFETVDLPESAGLAELIDWRARLYRLELVGQQASRYEGFGYGNVSLRTSTEGFLISGSQTGSLEHLPASHFVEVTAVDLPGNRLAARGRVKPSSEALTHASVYCLHPDIGCVLHVHSPEVWCQAKQLGLPCTPADIEYGTVHMAAAVAATYPQKPVPVSGVFAMLGHLDGVVAFGPDPATAGSALLELLD